MGNEVFKITYVGKDTTFFLKLQDSIRKKYTQFDFSFTDIHTEPKNKIQSLITQIAPDNNVIIIDLTVHQQEILQLCRVIKRSNNLKKTPLMGLFDQQIDESILKECIMTGIKINHLKTSENEDFIYDLFASIKPDQVKELEYVQAELSDEFEIKEYIKGGYIGHDLIHAEGDLEFKQDEEIKISSFLTENKIISSQVMKVKKISTDNIFYNFQYAYDLAFKYADFDEGSDATKYVEAVDAAKSKLNKWLASKNDISYEKKTKILIIDRTFAVYKENIKIDSYPFMVRCQPYFLDTLNELKRNNPHIILIGLDEQNEQSEKYDIKNDVPMLQNLMVAIRSRQTENYEPYLVIFNTAEQKDDLVKTLGYEKVMCIPGPITAEYLVKMGQIFEAKWQKKLDMAKAQPRGLQPTTNKVVFLSKDNPLSILELNRKITVKTLTESELTFNADFTPLNGGVYLIEKPFRAYITMIPPSAKPSNNAGVYRAVINGIGEEEKVPLRQFINSVFFRDLEESKKEDKESLEKIKEAYLAKRAEEAKKAEEEARKKAEAEAKEALAKEQQSPAEPTEEPTKENS
jgi:hypothetical protein